MSKILFRVQRSLHEEEGEGRVQLCSGCGESLELFETPGGWLCENCLGIYDMELEEDCYD